jgi:hypothetical protein
MTTNGTASAKKIMEMAANFNSIANDNKASSEEFVWALLLALGTDIKQTWKEEDWSMAVELCRDKLIDFLENVTLQDIAKEFS